MQFTEDGMRARFHALTAEREKILAKSGPLRAERDAFVQETRPKEQAMNAAIKKAEAGLFDIDQERAALARALKGKTGEPPQA